MSRTLPTDRAGRKGDKELSYDIDTRQAYSEHLAARPWDFFSTVTFREPRYDKISVIESLTHAFDKLDAERVFVAIEPHRLLGGVHAHCLSRHTFRPDMRPEWLWKYLYKAFGRATVSEINNCEPIVSVMDGVDLKPQVSGKIGAPALVTWYCAKYVTKGEDFEYAFLGDGAAWTQDT